MAKIAGRHYRVAKKEVEHSPERGTFIPWEGAEVLVAGVAVFIVVVFVKGIVLGYLCGKKRRG